MSDAPLSTASGLDAQPPLPLRRLHNFIYCPRLFYFQWVENIFQENADTVSGTLEHRNVDHPTRFTASPGDLNLPEGAKIRSLRLESEALGLIGVVDIVEGGPDGAEVIDYKKGSARRNAAGERIAKDADAVQVAAQALLLRENGLAIARAAIYYAADRRRVPVELNDDLFAQVRAAAAAARALAASGKIPPPLRNDPRCLYCSAYPICLPKETAWWAEMAPPASPVGQLQFGFLPAPPSAEVRERLLAALDFAAESTGEPTAAPPLALDLMEEFRALTADSVAISLINRGEIGPEDFIRAASGTFLNDHGRKAFWEAWFRRLDTGITHPEFGYRMAYRRMFEIQARQLWRFLRGEANAYHAFTTR